MRYKVTNEFIKINESQGTIQNTSQIYTVEVSNQNVVDSGALLYPLNQISFSDTPIYLRCVDSGGWAAIRVFNFKGTSQSDYQFADDSDADNIIDDAWNNIYDPPDDADSVINDMWNSSTATDTGDGFSDFLNDIFP